MTIVSPSYVAKKSFMDFYGQCLALCHYLRVLTTILITVVIYCMEVYTLKNFMEVDKSK